MAHPHFLIVGLGNITHPMTRHSIGHLLIDVLSTRLGIPLTSDRGGFTATTNLQVEQNMVTLTFYKPRALMNISGRPTVQMLRKTAVNPANMVVIHDSVSHKPFTISPKFGGSAGGHNGVRDIIAALGNNPDFHRLRLGVGRGAGDLADYVLGPLSTQERQHWSVTGPGSEHVWRELTRIIQKSLKT
ncbi:peptidyl-tRNA hydrolase [Lentinus tigrinus ALCF2SS1-7]|uniref:peptidyl-tRNA hydrolase n=1 Tax=Lentinus tigrinus ALCF2SS1-6 TaxID=1328759 RepID=A0A5C2S271_9APHY|nr:peptidyl-tRNA hydrolase [Lentinus tigrinus ALCF2SS1-6]RPD78785.1 peptidyl-tRNA hydrolase [Lentinus tigrinus ALCF2SS1-7]